MKKYSQEFKDSTVQLIINNNESVSQIAKDLDIHPKSLYAWVTAYKKEHNMPIRNLEKSTILKESEAEELKRLRRENKILKQERDILKKATAYFAKETL
ncbi:MAG: transposase [Fusobacteriaceae bacterium]|jgi:transposase|nr:transposase [Fusobacteriaceae bacterium]